MYLIDSARVMLFAWFLAATICFFNLSWQTRNAHPGDYIVQKHFMEHAIAASMAFIGSLTGVIYSVVHLFSLEQNTLSEEPFSVAMMFLLISGTAFMTHMIKEQTPGHPYYIRENGELNEKLNKSTH